MGKGSGENLQRNAISVADHSSQKKPLLLLDIDGALSADAMGSIEANGYTEHHTDGGRLVLSQTVCSQIATLKAQYELVWCSAWNEKANHFAAPLMGLPHLPVIELDVQSAYAGMREGKCFPEWTYKLPAVQAYVGDRAVAWIDDQIGSDMMAWGKERAAATLFVAVSANRGLQDAQLQHLRVWNQSSLYEVV
jgi:hypothetical protein